MYTDLKKLFAEHFGHEPELIFSAPGRTELGGNHTDHQHGSVLAAAIDLDVKAAAAKNGLDVIRICSRGYADCEISLSDLRPRSEEVNTSAALIRGVAARFSQLGCVCGGFDAYIVTDVLPGSGLSSSAAFEVLLAATVNRLFFDSALSPTELAAVGQYAENVYFGKPCGMMDQLASAVGGVTAIDFSDINNPAVQAVDFDFEGCGYDMYIISCGADHASLTDEYRAITDEMRAVSAFFSKDYLRDVSENEFFARISDVRTAVGDRAVLRAMHFFDENRRVDRQVQALRCGDFDTFLRLTARSGRSSAALLQNIVPSGSTTHQDMAFALALAERALDGTGACRVHGGGFAGTVQAFVPKQLAASFKLQIESVLGSGACRLLSIRKAGVTVTEA